MLRKLDREYKIMKLKHFLTLYKKLNQNGLKT